MKIKTKKQMNFAQLLKWAMDNSITDTFYSDDRDLIKVVDFYKGGLLDVHGRIYKTTTFTVEVKEEITEETPLSIIIECDEDLDFWMFENTTLKNIHGNTCGKESTKYYRDKNENMHLIWRDGKLVE